MTSQWDCSELREAASLLQGLMGAAGRGGPGAAASPGVSTPLPDPPGAAGPDAAGAAGPDAAGTADPKGAEPAVPPPAAPADTGAGPRRSGQDAAPGPRAARAAPAAAEGLRFRSDQLEQVLADLCARAGFHGALVADRSGLPVAGVSVPMPVEQAAAFASVLGEALGQAERLLGQVGANHVTVDMDFADKVVLHHFDVAGAGYHLVVFSPQDVDDRAEVALSAAQIAQVLEG